MKHSYSAPEVTTYGAVTQLTGISGAGGADDVIFIASADGSQNADLDIPEKEFRGENNCSFQNSSTGTMVWTGSANATLEGECRDYLNTYGPGDDNYEF